MTVQRFRIPSTEPGVHEVPIPDNTDLFDTEAGPTLIGMVDYPAPERVTRRFVVVEIGGAVPELPGETAVEKVLLGRAGNAYVWELDPPDYQGRPVIRYPKSAAS